MNTASAFKPRDVIQFLSGPKRGLLAQIALIDGALKCLARDMDGTPHIFDMAETDDARLLGTAVLGPKSDGVAPPAAETPPAIEPLTENEITGLLEPLPTDVKPQPLAAADDAALRFSKEDEERLVTSAYAPYRATRRKRVKKAKKKAVKEPRKDPPRQMWTAIVRNGLGQETTVTVPVREGIEPVMLTGVAVTMSKQHIPFIRPFTVSDWTRVVQTVERTPSEGPELETTSERAAEESI